MGCSPCPNPPFQTGDSLRPLASKLYPLPALHFPKRKRDEVGNRQKEVMEGAEGIPLEITPWPAIR